MTPQEQTMLDELIARVDNTQLQEKDPEAAQKIDQWSSRNRDAAYILAQTVLVQCYALEQAKAQIQSLQQAQQQPAKATSFLGGLFGHKDEPRNPAPPQQYAPAQQGYAPVPQYAAPAYPSQPYSAPQGYAPAGGGSSFLRSAATTAAGVAAGALAFEGIESLMHGFGHAAGFGGFAGGGFGEFSGRPEETVINNYYDTPAAGEHDAGASNAEIHQFAREGDSDLTTQQDLADDVNVGDDAPLQTDTDLPDLDSGSFDDASLDDGSFSDDSFDNS